MRRSPRPVAWLLLLLLLLALPVPDARSALPAPRPYGGCGVLALKPFPSAARTTLVFYREPGVARVVEIDVASLPRLSGGGDAPLVAVSARRGGWNLVAYDDAGRTGWVEQARGSVYLTWREFLPGRSLRVLPGMKKGLYALRSAPGAQGEELGSLSRDQAVRVLAVEGDWVRLQAPSGWFRWRDGDERLTVGLEDEAAEKR